MLHPFGLLKEGKVIAARKGVLSSALQEKYDTTFFKDTKKILCFFSF